MTRPNVRARDMDRAVAASALDSAYADGQMSFDEHRSRTERARTAVTLSDLRALVSDLQLDVDLPEPLPRETGSPRRILWASAAVAVLVVGLVVFLVSRPSGDDAADPVPASSTVAAIPAPLLADVEPIVAVPFVFDTPAGLDDFRTRYVERFGSAEVTQVYLDPADGRADVYRPTTAGDRIERVSVSGGFEVFPETDLRDPSDVTFDWNLLDSSILAGLIAGAPVTLGVPGVPVQSVTVDVDDGDQEIDISVYDDDRRGGSITSRFDGSPIRVNAY